MVLASFLPTRPWNKHYIRQSEAQIPVFLTWHLIHHPACCRYENIEERDGGREIQRERERERTYKRKIISILPILPSHLALTKKLKEQIKAYM
jgi:hypothetical protein